MLSFVTSIDPYALAALIAVVTMAAMVLRQMWLMNESLATLRDAMDAGGQGIMFFDRRGRLQQANRHVRRYLPFLAGDHKCLLSDILDYLFDHAVEADEGLRQMLAKSITDFEGGKFREVISIEEGVLCLAEMRKMESGRTVILMRDVTRVREREEHVLNLNQELKIKEAEFYKAQKLDALGRLAAGVAHDFNNILSIVDGYSHMILRHIHDPEMISQNVQKLQQANKRGAALTRQMLTFSRHKIVDDKVIDVGKAVIDQENLLMPLMEAGIDLQIEIKEDNLNAECSADNLGQVILNLGINARDALPMGGSIRVVLEACESCDLPEAIAEKTTDMEFLRLSVSDDGAGMDKETQERIFDPFYTTKENGKGTGLGLSVVYGMVKEMSGIIHVESMEGQGTTFSIYIPRSYEEPTKQLHGSADNPDSIELKGYTVLVAEDEPDLRAVMCSMLEERGMHVISAADGDEALALQDDHCGDIDILLTDVVMPNMNGIKLAELFLSLRPDSHVIFMSGYPASGDIACGDLPDDAYFMAKPVDYNALWRLFFVCLNGGGKDENLDLSNMTAAHWKTQNLNENPEEPEV